MRRSQQGYSLVETTVVLAMCMVMAGFAILSARSLGPSMRANNGLTTVVTQMRLAREQAIAQRRQVQVQFIGNNQLQLTRVDLPAGTTVLSTVVLDRAMQFTLFAGLPDTPENFGNSFAIDFGGTPLMSFLSDGTFVDATGQPLNGTIFIGAPNNQTTARAVTILGATGRVHGYRWNGSAWAQ